LTVATKPLLARGSPGINGALLAGFGASCAALYALVPYPLPGSAFGICVWLALGGTLCGVLAWTAESAAARPGESLFDATL